MSSCPPFGWAEGMVRYIDPKTSFPTEDTKNNPTDECAFHEWSWEAFVWATAFVPSNPSDPSSPLQPRFLTLPSLDALGQPARLELARVGPKPLELKPRVTKSFEPGQEPGVNGITQAGSEGILIDQHGQAVYYSQHANPAYYDFLRLYYGVENYQKASPTLEFPVGAAVFKASWHVVAEGEDASKFFTTQATVPMLINNAKGVAEIDPSGKTRQVTVALVGLHVVGTTVNHPEFLWSTFEQVRNAPDLPQGTLPAQPVSTEDFTFYKAGTPMAECNKKPAKESVSDPAKQTLTPVTNVYREFAYGGDNAAGVKEIDSINKQSQEAVTSFPKAPAQEAIWANYKLIGTVWLPPNSLKPGEGNLAAQAVGSVDLASSTMESFVQKEGLNCFSCHNTGGNSKPAYPGKDVNLSHKLLEPFFTGPGSKAVPMKSAMNE